MLDVLSPEVVDAEIRNKEIQQTIDFVVRAHNTQCRQDGGLPYIVHPMAVLALVADWDINCSKIWKAALAHDVLEDGKLDGRPVTKADLIPIVGEPASNVVEELTFIYNPLLQLEKPDQKKVYMESFHTKSIHALVVKVADRICNTADFLSGRPDYAPKYWKKAANLFEVMASRSQEIIQAFGEPVFPRMRYTITNMHQMLN